jgi:hypothetical protein
MESEQITAKFLLVWAVIALISVFFIPIGYLLLWFAARKYRREDNRKMVHVCARIAIAVPILLFIVIPLVIELWNLPGLNG